MHMTFADLVGHSPGFSLVTWPGGFHLPTINGDVSALIEAVDALVAKRETQLLHNRVAFVSSRQQHWVLARLLACFGADVHFVCSDETIWDPVVHPVLFQLLFERLEVARPELDIVSLQSIDGDNYRTARNFQIERRTLQGDADPLKDLCQFTFLVDVLPNETAALEALVANVRCVAQVGGYVEVFGSCDATSVGVVDALVESSGHLGLGLERGARGESWPGPYRLSFSCLSSSTYEYPRGEQDHVQLMAHCEARLRFAAQFVAGARVLEAGCGTGIGARLFRAEGGAASVVGLDYSRQAIDAARKATHDSSIEFREWDLNQTPLPLPSESFDVVVCLEVIEHVKNQHELVSELHRVLKPGGRVLLSIPNRAFEEEWIKINRFRNVYHVQVPSREDFEVLLNRFAQVSFARQIDFVGSVVVEDGCASPQGNFAFQSNRLNRETATVIFAVGHKGPVTPEPITPKPQLRLYDNYLSQQIDWRRGVDDLRDRFLSEQHKRWSERNPSSLADRDTTSRAECDRLERWIACDVEAYSHLKIAPGPWMDRLATLLQSARARGRAFSGTSAAWEIEVKDDQKTFSLRHFTAPKPFGASVVFPKSELAVSLKQIWRWRRSGVSEVWFFEQSGWKQVDMAILLARRLFKAVTKATLFGLAGKLGLHTPETLSHVMVKAQNALHRPGIGEIVYPFEQSATSALWPAFIESSNQNPDRPAPVGDRPVRFMEYTGALYPGGAERQFCNFTVGLKRKGVEVDVLTTENLRGERGHYGELLCKEGIAVRQAKRKQMTPEAYRTFPWHLLQHVPYDLVTPVINLAAEISAKRPDVLHCWLDQPNLVGGIAGLMAGVPAIVLSTRNANPTLLPRIDFPYLQQWYKTLAQSSRVHFIANSRPGAESYAQWLDLPVDRFNVIFNGVCLEQFPPATDAARAAARAQFGLSDGDRVVCGAFRLAAEKQPALFLDVIRRVRERVPNLRVLLAGSGDLDRDVSDIVQERGMSGYLQLLGRRNDVATVLLASDVCLLTSFIEGCPNVALESQHLGVPMVATAAGGAVDAVDHGRTGFIAGVDDAETLADRVATVLLDDALRARLSAAAPGFVRDRFGLEVMVDQTYEFCLKALEGAGERTAALQLDGRAA